VAEEDRENQTEPASERKLQRAREEGQVAVGHDAVLVASTLAAASALVALGGVLRSALTDMIGQVASAVDRTPFSTLPGLAVRPAAAVAAVCAAAGLAAITATFAQTGGGFWPHLAAPDLSRLGRGGRLARLFRKDFALDLLLALAKVVAVGVAAWSVLQHEWRRLPGMLSAAPGDQLASTFRVLGAAGRPVLGVALVLAAAELALSRWRFADQMKMTKEEVKRESKEDDGDPLLKGKRKRRHRDLMRNRARVEVPRADALVVNPTHVAVAIRYRRDEGRAPRVTAKGKGALADTMRALARENAVPIYQDVPLARLLYRKVPVGREIPAQTYKAVAAVLAFVYRVTGRRQGVRA